MSKVDVPEALIQKRCIGYWPDMYDLDQALRPPTPSSDDSQANGVSP
jgi:hypothetical protein